MVTSNTRRKSRKSRKSTAKTCGIAAPSLRSHLDGAEVQNVTVSYRSMTPSPPSCLGLGGTTSGHTQETSSLQQEPLFFNDQTPGNDSLLFPPADTAGPASLQAIQGLVLMASCFDDPLHHAYNPDEVTDLREALEMAQTRVRGLEESLLLARQEIAEQKELVKTSEAQKIVLESDNRLLKSRMTTVKVLSSGMSRMLTRQSQI
ncbi:hypothetical protein IWX90DRAFT_413515 [Phyllosticta citrichinensis]|uniref:Uncharacterized protein n=1 Tax=Phyllosticta citrichinensis TaxID=1130410 RepID=A0ABR1Y107_9PEZI